MDKLEANILSWLEDESDFEDASTQIVENENISDSDRSTIHSEHNTETEQSADSDASNNKEKQAHEKRVFQMPKVTVQ